MDTNPVAPGVQTSPLTLNEGGSGEFTVVLNTEPTQTVSVIVINPDATGAVAVTGQNMARRFLIDFLTTNWNMAQTVTVTAEQDRDADSEQIVLTFFSGSVDSNYQMGSIDPADLAVTVNVIDDEGSPPPASLRLRASTLTPAEGSTVTVTASLDNPAPSGDTTVTLTLSGAAAGMGANADYTLSSDTITIAAGEREGMATIAIASDSMVEADETIILDAMSSSPTLTAERITLTIADVPPGVAASVSALTVAKGEMATYTLVLRTPPAASVTVTVSNPDTDALTLGGLSPDNTLIFGTDDWSTPQTVTVRSVQNDEPGDVRVVIGHAAGSTDAGYVGLSGSALPSVVVTIRDDEGRPLDEVSRLLAPELSRLLADGAVGAVARRIARAGGAAWAAEEVGSAAAGAAAVSAAGVTTAASGSADGSGSPTPGVAAAAAARSGGVTAVAGSTADAAAAASSFAGGSGDPALGVAAGAATAAVAAVAATAAANGSAGGSGVAVPSSAAVSGTRVHRHAQTLAALSEGPEGRLSLAGLARLLDGSEFVLPLHRARQAGAGQGSKAPAWLSTLTLWGGGEYRRLENDSGNLNWEADAVSARVGLDARIRDHWLLGAALAWGRGTVDDPGDEAGAGGGLQEYRLSLGSVLPYLAWTPKEGVQLWLSGGYGQGTVRLRGEAQSVRSDAAQYLAAGGARVRLLARGRTRLHLRLEGQGVWLDIDGSGGSRAAPAGGPRASEMSAHKVQTRTFRALLEGRRTVALTRGVLTPALELGVRHDGGDGDSGAAALVGGELRYQGLRGLQAQAGGELLLGRSDYREWGLWGLVSWEKPDGRGWSLRLSPRYGLGYGLGHGPDGPGASGGGFGLGNGPGNGLGNSGRLWQRGAAGVAGVGSADALPAPASARLDLRIGYGLAKGLSSLAPYSELSLADEVRRLRLGVQWRLGGQWELDLAGERLEYRGAGGADTAVAPHRANPEHRILLEGRLRY